MGKRIVPQGSNVLVNQLSKEDVTHSGIVLPDFDADKRRDYTYGMVLDVGDGYDTGSMHQADVTAHLKEVGEDVPWSETIPRQLKPGDKVMVNSYGIEKTKLSGKEHFLVGKVHVAARVDEVVCRICDDGARLDDLMPMLTRDAAYEQLCTNCWGAYLLRSADAQPQEAQALHG